MQRPVILFLLVFSAGFFQNSESQAKQNLAQKADSLFNAKNYQEASILYTELLRKHEVNRSNAYLKLAFISEQSGDFSRAIYYLSNYYSLNPNEVVFQKISSLAKENSFIGYNESDLNFFFLLFRQYFIWVLISLVIISFYMLVVIFIKRNQGKWVSLNQKLSLLVLLFSGLALINVPKIYQQGIVNKEHINLRSEPSSASSVSQTLPLGARVNIIGEEDMWLKLLVNRDIRFGRKSDIWIIEKD
jgi:tetratricopeptide (TPR) repeat protein